MSPVLVGIVSLAVFFLFLAFGLPVGVTMVLIGLVGMGYLILSGGGPCEGRRRGVQHRHLL